MILMKRYEEIMNRIEVTEEMRARVLQNVTAAVEKQPQPRVSSFAGWKRILSAAACIALLLVGAGYVRLRQTPVVEEPPTLEGVMGMQEVPSSEELSAAVGFAVEEPQQLPFEVSARTYTSYWGDMAEILLEGEGESARFRMQKGSGDTSGDWNQYANEAEISFDGVSGVLKGDDAGFTLAVWEKDGFSYSLSLSSPQPQQAWEEIIAAVA